MPQSGRTFRIFVSSTFSDLVAERNALQERVFPRLRELAMAHGCHFQAIDLRWGVSEEAALDQQTMRICLTEIERCQRATPRPNFLILLGDRYGWRPLPYAIPAAEFEALLPHLAEHERALACWREDQPAYAKGWYRRDDNAVPPEYVLRPREPRSWHSEYAAWHSEVERPLGTALERAARQAGLEGGALAKYTLSATGQEIERGAMGATDARENVFGFFRSISNLDALDASAGGTAFVEADPDLRHRQQDLRARLRQRLGGNIHEFVVEWRGYEPPTAHIGTLPETLEECLKLNDAGKAPKTLCQAVWLRLSRVILAETGKLEAVDALQREQEAHHEFGRERARLFVAREESLARIAGYLAGSDPHPLVVWGESGSGKSALMARAMQQAQERTTDRVSLVARFIGATPESSTGRALLESLCRQITRAYGGDESTIPFEYGDLVSEFPKSLALATAEKPLMLFLDALDQLSDSDNARSLAWLPSELPGHVKLVVSTLPGECLAALEGRLPASSLWNVPALGKANGERLLRAWLDDARRTLTGEQWADVMQKFERCGELPLYLKLAFEEARQWHAYDGLPALSGKTPGLSEGVPGVIHDLLSRLEEERNHGHVLVSRALGYLAAARNGLSEDELLDVLWEDEAVRDDFYSRSPNTQRQVFAMPVVIWARLYLDLEPYLAHRRADGADLMGFYQRQLAEAAQANYVRRKRHAGLAAYFTPQPLYLEGGEAAPNHRKLSEMVYQQARAGLAAQVESALLDYSYLRAKLAGQGVQELVEDYALAPAAGVEGEKPRSLSLVEAALRLSAHVLGRDPSQLPGQLIGRLLGSGEVDVQGLLEAARQRTPGPWLRPLSASLERPGGALVRTLTGHDKSVTALALTPDGRLAVSASHDKTLKVWDVASGTELRTLRGHTESVVAVALTPDGRLAVSGSYDAMLKVWDVARGREMRTLAGHTCSVNAVALTPDGRLAVSGSADNTLKVWDVESGRELRTLAGHRGTHWSDSVSAVALTPDGRLAVSGSSDDTLKVWDVESGRELHTLAGHPSWVEAVALTPDGRVAVSASQDRMLKVWDMQSGTELRTLAGHREVVRSVAVTADGRRAVSGSFDRTVKVWDLESGEELLTLAGHTSLVEAVAVTPDGRLAVSGSADNTLKVWDIPAALNEGLGSPTELPPASGHDARVWGVALAPDGRVAVSASQDGTLKVWDMQSGTELRNLTGHGGDVTCVALTPDGRRAVSGSYDTTLKLWDVTSGRELYTLTGHNLEVTSVALTPDGQVAVSASNDETLRVWDVAYGTALNTLIGHSIGFVETLVALALTPDGRLAVSTAKDTALKVWDVESGKGLHTLPGDTGQVRVVALTPDGRLALSGSHCALQVWDLESGSLMRTLPSHRDWVLAVALTPDGRLAVSASADRTLMVLEMASGRLLRTLIGHTGPVNVVALTPDGRLILSASDDGTLRVWDGRTGAGLATYSCDRDVLCCAVGPDGRSIVLGDLMGGMHFLRLEGVTPGPAVVTAWRCPQTPPTLMQRILRRRAQPVAFGCPTCRAWSEIPRSALGMEVPCPHCCEAVRLNPFVIEADWQPVAAAWQGDA